MPRTRTPRTRTALAQPDALRDGLLAAIDLLHRRRVGEIPEDVIDAYIRMDWMKWHGGGLRVTTVGENVCLQLRSGLA